MRQPIVETCRGAFLWTIFSLFNPPRRPPPPARSPAPAPVFQSFALAIVGAEYLAGIVPVGTHDWQKFVPPEDLVAMLHSHGFPQEGMETCGLMYNPVSGRWKECPGDLDVNYIMTAVRRA